LAAWYYSKTLELKYFISVLHILKEYIPQIKWG